MSVFRCKFAQMGNKILPISQFKKFFFYCRETNLPLACFFFVDAEDAVSPILTGAH